MAAHFFATRLALVIKLSRGSRIYDGPDEVHKSSVARRILKPYEARAAEGSAT